MEHHWKKHVEKTGLPLEPGEVLIDAFICEKRGLTATTMCWAGAFDIQANLGTHSTLGQAAKIVRTATQRAIRSGGGPHAGQDNPLQADLLPAGQWVLAITNRRYRLYALNPFRGVLHAKLIHVRDESLDWISDCTVEHRLTAPAFTVIFRDGSKARLELPRSQGNPRRIVDEIHKAKIAVDVSGAA